MAVSDVLTAHGLGNVAKMVQAAGQTNVLLWIATALIENEFGARNVYGAGPAQITWPGGLRYNGAPAYGADLAARPAVAHPDRRRP